MIWLLAATIPLLYWDTAPGSAALAATDIARIAVPAHMAAEWSGKGPSVEAVDPATMVHLPAPGVDYKFQEASATSEPWLNTNAARLLREPAGHFYYEAPGAVAPLAAAEASMWDGDAVVHTDNAGVTDLARMLDFLKALSASKLTPRVNIGFVDDGSDVASEVMKLMVRRNLLFRIVPKPDPKLDLNVQLGSRNYSKEQAQDPYFVSQKIRSDLGDEKRLVRIYGSSVVVARLLGDRKGGQLRLLNYAAVRRPARGLRIRVNGPYRQVRASVYGTPGAEVMDVTPDARGVEFTVPQLDLYGVFELAP